MKRNVFFQVTLILMMAAFAITMLYAKQQAPLREAALQDTTLDALRNKKITVTGITKNAKLGAVVVTAKNETYYIADMPAWDAKLLHKKVRVSGVADIHTLTEDEIKTTGGEYVQGHSDEIVLIYRAKIKRVKNTIIF